MKLARYWTRGSADGIFARGWSDESLEAAHRRAKEIAGKIAAALASGQLDRQKQYLYGDRPLPEPILREFGAEAAVTRNAYGALVLNTSRLMFVDIDIEEPPPANRLIASVMSLFGGKADDPPKSDGVVDRISSVATRNGLSVRVYKTAAGYRGIVTNAPIEAGSVKAQTLLQQFASDPLYIRLCRAQESYRARLTPKPWRCGAKMPTASFPFMTAAEESEYRAWDARYTAASNRFATCQYLCAFGGHTDPELDELIRYHDQETRSTSGLPLA